MRKIYPGIVILLALLLIVGCATFQKPFMAPTSPPDVKPVATPDGKEPVVDASDHPVEPRDSGETPLATPQIDTSAPAKTGTETGIPDDESTASKTTTPETPETLTTETTPGDETDLGDLAERNKRLEELKNLFLDIQKDDTDESRDEAAEASLLEEGTLLGTGPSRRDGPPGSDLPDAQEGIVINFDDATVQEALEALSEIIGMDYLLSPGIGGGSVTIKSSVPIKKKDIYYVIQSILELNNLVAIDVGPYYKIVPSPEARFRPIETRIGKKSAALYSDDSVITQVIPLEFMTPDEIIATLQPLIAEDATLITHPGTNLLIMTGLQSNLRRLLKIIELLDVDTAQLELEIFQIKYADATDIVTVLEQIFAEQGVAGATSRTNTSRTAQQRRQQQRSQSIGQGTGKQITFIPDLRSNSIIVFAQKKDLSFVREIIAMLDVDIYVTRKTYIYYVENATASDLASLLSSVYTQQGTRTPARRTQNQRSGAAGTSIGTDGLEGEVNIVADERTNALIIVTAPVNYPYILETIKLLDIMPKQVLIEVLIADIDLQDASEFGVEWSLRSQGEAEIGNETYYFDGTSRQFLDLGDVGTGFTYTLFEPTRFQAFLRAYARDSRLEVLSNPHIMVANNQEAKIEVGQEVPIVTAETGYNTDISSNTNVTQSFNRTIQYRTTGILLTVTPHINEKRYVNLEVSQEVSNLSSVKVQGIDSPVIDNRSALTNVVVRDGETLVIGGMIQRKRNPSREGIPWLYKIPVIGPLFGSRSNSVQKTELLIFLTPHVIGSPDEAQILSRQLRDKMTIRPEIYRDVSLGME